MGYAIISEAKVAISNSS